MKPYALQWFALLGIMLFLGVVVTPSINALYDDTTPPITTISFDPPEPNGNNGWYVTKVSITLNATDDDSGVNVTHYRINQGPWLNYTDPFNISQDDEYLLEYYSIDFAGNQEPIQNECVKIDRAKPDIDLIWEQGYGNEIILTADCYDDTSGIDRVEFFKNDSLQEIVYEPPYSCIITINYTTYKQWHAGGWIYFKEMNETIISMFAFLVIIRGWTVYPKLPILHAVAYDNAGNFAKDEIPSQGTGDTDLFLIILQPLKLLNNFTGSITRFRINADFNQNPII